jgi:hypothetical protein
MPRQAQHLELPVRNPSTTSETYQVEGSGGSLKQVINEVLHDLVPRADGEDIIDKDEKGVPVLKGAPTLHAPPPQRSFTEFERHGALKIPVQNSRNKRRAWPGTLRPASPTQRA